MSELGQQEEEGVLRIMLLGKSGGGKSSSGNTILGKEVFESDLKLDRVTRFCEKETGTVGGVPVAVIDTPGLFETDHENKENAQNILQCGKLLEPGPHAFVLVLPIGRMTQEDTETYTLIETMFGPRVWDYTIVLFTHGDRLDGKTINGIITESGENLRNFIRKCRGNFHVFNNKDPEDLEQVEIFLKQIQILVALNGGRCYENELYPEKEKKIRERQKKILAERDTEIRDKERDLPQRYQGDELKMMKKELWRKEETKARLAAEKQINKETNCNKILLRTVKIILIFFLLLLTVGAMDDFLEDEQDAAEPFLWLLVVACVWIISVKWLNVFR